MAWTRSESESNASRVLHLPTFARSHGSVVLHPPPHPSTDPYHVYFQHKITLIQEGRTDDDAPSMISASDAAAAGGGTTSGKTVALAPDLVAITLTDRPPKTEFLADPPSIMAQDLDILKLTAQFVARNGRSFLSNLMKREAGNYQFDFLRPQHSLFHYFTCMVDQVRILPFVCHVHRVGLIFGAPLLFCCASSLARPAQTCCIVDSVGSPPLSRASTPRRITLCSTLKFCSRPRI